MNVAVLICGQPRFTEDFNRFLSHLKGYDRIDWFCYFTGDNASVPENKLPSPFWRQISDVNRARDEMQSMLPANNFIQAFELSDSDYIDLPQVPPDVPTPAYKIWYNLYKVNQLRLQYEESNSIAYDMIIRTRPDVGLVADLDLSAISSAELEQVIIMPKNKIAGHLHYSQYSPQMCDMLAIANSSKMNVYCDMIHDAHKNPFTQSRAMWHTESAHAQHLRNNNVLLRSHDFIISIRGDAG